MILLLTLIGWIFAILAVYEAAKFWRYRNKFGFRSVVSFAFWTWAFAALPRGVYYTIGLERGSGDFVLRDEWTAAVVGTAVLLPVIISTAFLAGIVCAFLFHIYQTLLTAFQKLPEK